jgi:hypothetical protein
VELHQPALDPDQIGARVQPHGAAAVFADEPDRTTGVTAFRCGKLAQEDRPPKGVGPKVLLRSIGLVERRLRLEFNVTTYRSPVAPYRHQQVGIL